MSTIKQQFDLHTRLFNNVLEDISDGETNTQANEHVNHLKWLAGHLTAARYGFKDLAGLETEDPFGELFAHGKSIDPNQAYPSIEQIRNNFNGISGQISEVLGKLPAEALAAQAPNVPISGGKMSDFLDFLMHHEAYHLGQMGLLRKFLGKGAMHYN